MFTNFQSISEVQQTYGIRYEDGTFIVPTDRVPSDCLIEKLRFNTEHLDTGGSDAIRRQFLASPVLLDIYTYYTETLAFWADKPLCADTVLCGIPAYIFATKSLLGKKVLGLPLVLIVEAKKNDFDQGWGQCLAELVAAQKMNNTPEKPVFGIVTDAIRWEFGKLTANVFIQDEGNYSTDEITELFGAIDFVLKSSLSTLH